MSICFLAGRPARASDRLAVEATAAALGLAERNRPRPFAVDDPAGQLDRDTLLAPAQDDDAVLLFAGVAAEALIAPWLVGRLAFDTGVIRLRAGQDAESNGRPLKEEALQTGFLREASAEVLLGDDWAVGALAGRQRLRLGGGLVLDGYASGGDLLLESDDLIARAGVWLPGRELRPPGDRLLRAEIELPLGFFSSVTLFGAHYQTDGRGAIDLTRSVFEEALIGLPSDEGADLGRDAFDACADLQAQVESWWLGASGTLSRGRHRLRAALIGSGGEVILSARTAPDCVGSFVEAVVPEPPLRNPDTPTLGDLLRSGRWIDQVDRLSGRVARRLTFEQQAAHRGYAADLAWRVRAGAGLYPELRFLFMSGDDPAASGTTDIFYTIDPWITHTAVFFDAGLGSSFQSPGAAAAGVNGRGVIAPGARLLYVLDALDATATFASLFAAAQGPFSGSTHYGEELDLSGRLDLGERLALRAEYGVLWLGGFYPHGGTVHRLTIGLESTYP